MSKISELPNKSWSEEKIIELLDVNLHAASSASKEVRVVCLDELRRRKTINQVDRATEVLLEVARIRRRSTPIFLSGCYLEIQVLMDVHVNM